MSNGKTVTKCLYEAFEFVLDNVREVYLLAAPVLLFAFISTAYGAYSLYNQSAILSEELTNYGTFLIEPFIFAMFAVSWHRYTANPKERNINGISFRFGKREFKFGLFNLAITAAAVGLGSLIAPQFGVTFTVLIIFAFAIPVSLIAFFACPAIALDRPVNIGQFLNAGTARFLSFLKAFAVAILFLIVWSILLMLLTWLVGGFLDQGFRVILAAVIEGFILIPLATAIAVSTATKLYMDVFNYRSSEPADNVAPAE
ncbi:hypothetical protein [Sneathiella glossodoripedis]|uniref:hypothetical protein n=1 Tax=Sneathiella glossodoripedis TaxID=418853 RepID=UPI0004727B88|nr:hypothetical protein [Sneathiella glossodoripedis]